MPGEKYLPINEKAYSPIGVRNLFKKAVDEEDGDIQAVFKKNNKYKKNIELWHGSVLAVMIFNWIGDKYFLISSENPDIHFVSNLNTNNQKGFSIEIMSLFDYSTVTFDENYKDLSQKIWKKKGIVNYDRTELLLVSRLVGKINVDKFATEINKFNWNFLRIWLSVYNNINSEWTIFEIKSYAGANNIGKRTVKLSDLPY